MSIRPQNARWFELLTAREDLTLALETLARTGSIELETRSDTRAHLSLHDLQDRMEEYSHLARRYQPYWPHSDLQASTLPASPSRILDDALQHLRSWKADAAPLIRSLETLSSEQSELELLKEMLLQPVGETLDFDLLSSVQPPLAARLFVLPPGSRIEQAPGTVISTRVASKSHDFLLALGKTTDLESFATDLAVHKGRIVHLPPSLRGRRSSALEQVRQRLDELEQQLKEVRASIDALAETHNLNETLGDINRLDWFLTHVSSLPVSENFAWVTGWTSDLSGRKLQAALEKTRVNAMIHYPEPPYELSPPMVMHNPWWAQPFELFARLLGTPARDEADPSRLLAVLAPLLFGYMFGDVGHGLVLLVAGIVLQRRWPVLKILIANGIASVIFGFVFGSVFGRDNLIPALWVNPIQEPLPVLLVPLAGGVVILLIGLLLNAVESYWRGELRQWLHVEAAVLVLYLSIIGGFFWPQTLILAAAALIWFFIGSLAHLQGKPGSGLLTAASTLTESVLQLLINTVSFVRVGAFALAHGGLSLAFNILAEATGNIVTGLLILLLGNLIVIILEGLVVTIQTTRLILFEFFIRFLRGTGRMFRPLAAPDNEGSTRRTI